MSEWSWRWRLEAVGFWDKPTEEVGNAAWVVLVVLVLLPVLLRLCWW